MDMLLGLDMLKRHQVSSDYRSPVIVSHLSATCIASIVPSVESLLITFRTRHEMYCGLSVAACLQLLHGPECNLGSARGCPLVLHYWAHLQLVYGLRCYGNMTRTLVKFICIVPISRKSY